MEITKLLQALEEMLFEVACLAVLLPKTFFHLALFPSRVHRYVTEELAKKTEERFDGFAPPLLTWAVCGILPNFIFLSIITGTPGIRKLMAAGDNDLIWKLLTLPTETRFVAISVFAVSLPLAFAFVIAREGKKEATKSTLREPLYALSYCTAPILFAASPLWFCVEALSRGPSATASAFAMYYGVGLVFWTGWVGVSLFRMYLAVTSRRAYLLLGKAYVVFLGVMLLFEMLILMMVGTMTAKAPA